MGELTARLLRRIERDFPDAGSASEVVEITRSAGDKERVQAAVLLWGSGDLDRLRNARDLAVAERRDALMRANLADENWPRRLDTELGAS
jgi:hypothetical protein